MALNVGPAKKRRAHAGGNVWNVLQAVAKSHFDFFTSVSGELPELSYLGFRRPGRYPEGVPA
ncbi:hypothetical protein [Cupriavidus sp. D384]|uniref:hypothetical protein n=1 Tax=Cupriavidus sp. D384 TaxID=1538095 RepID=UPI0012E95F7A|nr:hypothetical protein [Cupriavidus sp. D384]